MLNLLFGYFKQCSGCSATFIFTFLAYFEQVNNAGINEGTNEVTNEQTYKWMHLMQLMRRYISVCACHIDATTFNIHKYNADTKISEIFKKIRKRSIEWRARFTVRNNNIKTGVLYVLYARSYEQLKRQGHKFANIFCKSNEQLATQIWTHTSSLGQHLQRWQTTNIQYRVFLPFEIDN